MLRNSIPIVSGAFIVGCAFAYFTAHPLALAIGVVGVSFILAFLTRKHQLLFLVFIAIVFFALGVLRVGVTDQSYKPFESVVGTEASVRGIVTSDIEHGKGYSRYEVTVQEINSEKTDATARVLVYDEYPTDCVKGEEVLFQGSLQQPKNFETTAGREFKYVKYLEQRNIYALAFIKETSCIAYVSVGKFDLFSFVREKLVSAMSSVLPQKETALLSGLLLGLRSAFSDTLLEYFRLTGLIHIIVLSGYNVTLVAEAVRRVTLWLSPRISLAISLVVIGLFVFLAGAQTAAVRAAGMGSIALIAKAYHREHDGIRALFLVTALMILYNPSQLLFSTSLHMSVLATLGLLLFSGFFERKLYFITNKFQIRGIIAVTTATQLFLLPYLAYAIGEVSIIGFIANILVLPFIPIAMFFGAIIAVIAIVSETLASVFAPIAHIPLSSILIITETLAQFKYATIPLPTASVFFVVATYVVITALGFKYFFKKEDSESKSRAQ